MTREEAARIITVILDCCKGKDEDYEKHEIIPLEKSFKALSMAIEALEQEETLQNLTKPNKSDLISRHEALKGYQSVCEGIACHECRAKDADGTCRLESFINNLPSAQPFTEEQIQTMQELEAAQVEKAYELGKADRPKWIPCSKRLPEENEPVLVGIRYKDDFKMVVTARMDVTYWQGLGRDIKGEMRWMPLPEPYEESDTE